MSYRDTRNVIEMLRVLGYPNLVSMESFRTPNFPLVADLLLWLSKRLDPDVNISNDISTEDDRVKLIRNVAQFMALKANIKLNTKRLYQADGYCIKEISKITNLLNEALNVNLNKDENENTEDDSFSARDFDISDKVNELKLSRQLASEITSTGATLFDLLAKEVELRSARQRSMARQFELPEVESGINQAIQNITQEIQESKQLIDNIAATESNLDSKIDRRKVEIDRYEKRLQTLKKVRPAFLEEFTSLEKQLEQLFIQYSTRLRCLNYLEAQFTESERIQIEKQLEITSPRVQVIPLENIDQRDLLNAIEENQESQEGRSGAINRQERPRASTGGRNRLESKQSKTFGGMRPPISGSRSSLDLSTDSESDELFLDKDEPELMNSDEESLALELSGIDRRAPSGRKTSSKIQENNSDDDF